MLESLVKLRRGLLQSHSCLKAVRRLRPFADESVNLLLNVDERLFHSAARVMRVIDQGK